MVKQKTDQKGMISKLIIIALGAALVGVFFAFDLGQYLTLDFLKQQQVNFQAYYEQNTIETIATYMLIYIGVTALSLPGAAIMTLAGGALFGRVMGTILVSFASTIGATAAFLVARFLLQNWVQERFSGKLTAINEGVKKDGAFYLFTLRLVPIFPFFVINLVMGLTPISVRRFFLVSQIGMLPGTIVYVNAGTEIAQIDSLKGILSPGLLISFVLLGVFPLLAKKSIELIKNKKKDRTTMDAA